MNTLAQTIAANRETNPTARLVRVMADLAFLTRGHARQEENEWWLILATRCQEEIKQAVAAQKALKKEGMSLPIVDMKCPLAETTTPTPPCCLCEKVLKFMRGKDGMIYFNTSPSTASSKKETAKTEKEHLHAVMAQNDWSELVTLEATAWGWALVKKRLERLQAVEDLCAIARMIHEIDELRNKVTTQKFYA